MDQKKIFQKTDTILNILNFEVTAEEIHAIVAHVMCAYINALKEEKIPREELVKYLLDVHNYIIDACGLSPYENVKEDLENRKRISLFP